MNKSCQRARGQRQSMQSSPEIEQGPSWSHGDQKARKETGFQFRALSRSDKILDSKLLFHLTINYWVPHFDLLDWCKGLSRLAVCQDAFPWCDKYIEKQRIKFCSSLSYIIALIRFNQESTWQPCKTGALRTEKWLQHLPTTSRRACIFWMCFLFRIKKRKNEWGMYKN